MGGLIIIDEFSYRFRNSVAKYELMTIDIPRVDYSTADETDPQHTIPDAESIRLNQQSVQKFRDRMKWKELNLSEFLNSKS